MSSSLVTCSSQRQGPISSSTDNAESSALHTETEEAQNFHCMVPCFEYNVPSDGSYPTRIFLLTTYMLS